MRILDSDINSFVHITVRLIIEGGGQCLFVRTQIVRQDLKEPLVTFPLIIIVLGRVLLLCIINKNQEKSESVKILIVEKNFLGQIYIALYCVSQKHSRNIQKWIYYIKSKVFTPKTNEYQQRLNLILNGKLIVGYSRPEIQR